MNGISFFDSKLVTACETALKERFLSPSQYKRVKILEDKTFLDKEEYKDRLLKEQQRNSLISDELVQTFLDVFEQGISKPVLYIALVYFDSPNFDGTPTRHQVTCSYWNDFGDVSRLTEYNVEIDDKTLSEWNKSKEERY